MRVCLSTQVQEGGVWGVPATVAQDEGRREGEREGLRVNMVDCEAC